MTISDIVGDVVQILLNETSKLVALGFEQTTLFLRVVGIDDMGVWVAHPNYIVVKVNDPEGKPLPLEKQLHERVDANFLIRWDQIATIVHFPGREGYDFPSPFEKHIGFVVPSSTGDEASSEPVA